MTTTRFLDARQVRHAIPALPAAGLFLVAAGAASADDFGDTLHDIQQRWAEANYRETGTAQKEAFETLLEDARQFAVEPPAHLDQPVVDTQSDLERVRALIAAAT